MLKIGILGLGGIAQKAYLPVISTMRDKADWYLCTRNQEVLLGLQAQYGFDNVYSDMDAFMELDLDAVFIHTPTPTHPQLIEAFLEKGVHVYVDKPLSEDIDDVHRLYKLAEAKQRILMVGFNRRLAPTMTRLKDVPQKNMILIQKTRDNTQQPTQFALFDMMIHVVDTAVYLMDEPIIDMTYRVVEQDGNLAHAVLQLMGEHCTVHASINMISGGITETVDVMSPMGHYRVENLDTLIIQQEGVTQVERFGDWTNTLSKRGFTQIIDHFITCIENNAASTIYTPEQMILSHELIAKINGTSH